MAAFERHQIVERFHAEIAGGRTVYDAQCGSSITVKMAARRDADLISTFNLALYRMQGLSSMAGYLPIGADPTRDMRRFVDRLATAGFASMMNCPTVAPIDGKFRADLEETGLSYAHEVDVLGYAHAESLFTKAFCTTPDEALAMAEASIDNIIVHLGNSSGSTIGSTTVTSLDEAASRAIAVCDALADRREDRILTCHGGQIETPGDFQALLAGASRLHGYVGGSSAERFPIEQSVPVATQGFKAVRLPVS